MFTVFFRGVIVNSINTERKKQKKNRTFSTNIKHQDKQHRTCIAFIDKKKYSVYYSAYHKT